jgi:hypothetical protein
MITTAHIVFEFAKTKARLNAVCRRCLRSYSYPTWDGQLVYPGSDRECFSCALRTRIIRMKEIHT